MEQESDIKEMAFAKELEKYANRWVAIVHFGSDAESVVASGDSIREARELAESSGFNDITFFRVPPADRLFVPLLPIKK